MAKQKMIGVVVTTEHKGVFFGYIPSTQSTGTKTVSLKSARMCVYWSPAMKGVFGLASIGPDSGCKISPMCPRLALQGVTAIMECTDAAVANWEAAPWAR